MYKINAIDIPSPTEATYFQTETFGIDGLGRKIPSSYKALRLSWGTISQDDYKILLDAYKSVQVYGPASVTIPEYGTGGWIFSTYSGCIVDEPDVGAFFETYLLNVSLTIRKIPVF